MIEITNKPIYEYGLYGEDYTQFKYDIKIIEFTDTILKVKSPMQYGSKLTHKIAGTTLGIKGLKFDYLNFEPFDDNNNLYIYKVCR